MSEGRGHGTIAIEACRCPASPPISAYLFTERPLIERFAAAAAAGFQAVELQFPYDHPPSAVKAELDRHGLTVLGINTAPGRSDGGEFGVAAIPGREREFAAVFQQALDYVVAIGGCAIHCLAGKVPPEQRPRRRRSSSRNLGARRRCGAREEHHAADRADQSARPAGLFPHPRRACRRHHRQGRAAERAHPVRLLSRADRRRRSHQAVREDLPGGRPCADRGGAVARTSPTKAR